MVKDKRLGGCGAGMLLKTLGPKVPLIYDWICSPCQRGVVGVDREREKEEPEASSRALFREGMVL